MASYPMTNISRTSRVTPDAGIRSSVATDGTIKFRRDRAVTEYQLQLVHEWITQTQLDAIRSFIASNGYGPHTFTGLQGANYSATLLNDPVVVDHRGPLYMVESQAVGVKV